MQGGRLREQQQLQQREASLLPLSLRPAPAVLPHPVKAACKLSQAVGGWFLPARHMCVSARARDEARACVTY